MILMTHVDSDMYSSIKGRIKLLKMSVPWVQYVRDTVTDSPGENKQHKGASGDQPLEKVGHRFERDRRNVFLRQRNQPRLRKPQPMQEKSKYFIEWTEGSESSTFVKFREDDVKWAELHDGKPAYFFEEDKDKTILKENRRQFTLIDRSRGYTIMLLESKSLLKLGPKEQYQPLYTGRFSAFDWKVIPETQLQGPQPPPPFIDGEMKDQSVVIMLAAFRDPLCSNTMFEAFKYAQYPDRVTVVIIQQMLVGKDKDCIQDYCDLAKTRGETCRRDQVRTQVVDLDHSRGVMPGRYRQHLLLQDEEFCLQCDSHSAFEDNWDTIAIEDWKATGNEMAVITTYPNRVNHKHNQKWAPVRCDTKFSGDGEVVHGGNSAHNIRMGKHPFLSPFFGAGTSFSKCHAQWNVPYDPYMSYLFGGEEFNRAVRLFTSGYDMYAPRRNFVYHYYDDDKRPAYFGDLKRNRDFFKVDASKKVLSTQTTARWRTILGLPLTKHNPKLSEQAMENAKYFGLGSRRPLEQYESFANINLKEAKAGSRCDDIGKMMWESYAFKEPFYPSGDSCPYRTMKDIRKYCCTTLDMVRSSTGSFLDKSNSEIAKLTVGSEQYSNDRVGVPIVSTLNNQAIKGVCPK
eukprot:CAMPEP_0203757354 /NCGR_PEP_ID=MMETSP0098-20131031/10457_1 /ASSEMBLY_ACC=CAM_ASM_000208 /TAXON_ID=96639 /ORGANISM=" , Strain NY0313808BC1" /LENGTH=625 /DNA_ID=CAMNT_0050649561 /DNA_START=191 /DNA_END=2068 /DNA_ORIENTATION=-